MPLEAINVGFGNVLVASRVVAVVRADSAPSRRMIEVAANAGRLIDATSGRRTRSLVITDSNHVLLSHLHPATLREKLTGSRPAAGEEADDAADR